MLYPPACAFHADAPLPRERTIAVGGQYRGGTSMVAGLLRILGVPIGRNLEPGNNEDLELRNATDARLQEVVARRNAEYEVWGWKDPGLHRSLYHSFSVLRNPRFVIVLRDVFACAQAEKWKGVTKDVVTMLRRKHDEQTRILGFVDRILAARRPLLLVSYERTLVNPARCVEQLAQFVGIPLDPPTRRRAIEFVEPERGHGDPDSPTASRDFLLGELQQNAPEWLEPSKSSTRTKPIGGEASRAIEHGAYGSD